MSNIISKSKFKTYRKQSNILSLKPNNKLSSINISQTTKPHKPFESLAKFEQMQLLGKIKVEYSLIIFDYFSSQSNIKAKITNFAQEAFAVNLPIDKVIEIHASLIDDLEHQLMLEGLRNSEYINEFRLILIDVIARLGELYRHRSL